MLQVSGDLKKEKTRLRLFERGSNGPPSLPPNCFETPNQVNLFASCFGCRYADRQRTIGGTISIGSISVMQLNCQKVVNYFLLDLKFRRSGVGWLRTRSISCRLKESHNQRVVAYQNDLTRYDYIKYYLGCCKNQMTKKTNDCGAQRGRLKTRE